MNDKNRERTVDSLDDRVMGTIAQDRQVIEATKAIVEERAVSTGVHLIKQIVSTSRRAD